MLGGALYFICEPGTRILEFDLGQQELSLISLQSACKDWHIALMTGEDGGLGFATVLRFRLHMWSREAGLDGDAGWSQRRVIELDVLIHDRGLSIPPTVLAVADSVGVIFVHAIGGLFTVDLKSGRVRKLSEGYQRYVICDIVPCINFCIPALGAASTYEGPRRGASSAKKKHKVNG
uniref:F-box protein AT5G49610-like beta-propeller domain-containing protein n=1 Tax=Arundo donax TaxID=35708 RepID=A0A0A9B791_ARUDO